MTKIALAGLGMAALACAPLASADPTPGHDAKVNTQTPRMLCEIGSDDATPGVGPNVICQGSFAQAPADDDQAFVTASGRFSYPSANIGVGYNHAPFDTLCPRPDLPHPGLDGRGGRKRHSLHQRWHGARHVHRQRYHRQPVLIRKIGIHGPTHDKSSNRFARRKPNRRTDGSRSLAAARCCGCR